MVIQFIGDRRLTDRLARLAAVEGSYGGQGFGHLAQCLLG
jgi:hypothetical protein